MKTSQAIAGMAALLAALAGCRDNDSDLGDLQRDAARPSGELGSLRGERGEHKGGNTDTQGTQTPMR
jgi:hypothetical protein